MDDDGTRGHDARRTTHDDARRTTTTHDDAMADVDSEYSEYDDSGSEFYDSENSPTPVKGKVRARARASDDGSRSPR